MADFLTDDVVAAVCSHMNDDHADDNVVIVRGVGGCPTARAATMVGMDLDGIDFDVVTDEGPATVRVPFAGSVEDRAQIRTEVVRLFEASRDLLGPAAG